MKDVAPFSEEEREALTVLAEECAEVIQAVTKALRHGPEAIDRSVSPPKGYNNLKNIEKESLHVIAALAICDDLGLVGDMDVDDEVRKKLARMQPYLHHVDARQLAIDFEFGDLA